MTVRLFHGDCRELLAEMPAGSVQCCVTSPPYFALRDYGTASWEGGDAECRHSVGGQVAQTKHPAEGHTSGVRPGVDASQCRKCGARRIDQQIGLEPTVEAFVAELVSVFRDVRRVLRDDGTLWLNLGDSYAANWNSQRKEGGGGFVDNGRERIKRTPGYKPKDLLGVPWMVAFALRADGWYLRSDIIWAKPNPMPESVRDRPTKAHEYLFLLSKSPRYYWDADAIAEPVAGSTIERVSQPTWEQQEGSHRQPGKTNGPMKAVVRYKGMESGYAPPVPAAHSRSRDGTAKGKHGLKQDELGKQTYTGFNGLVPSSIESGGYPVTRNARSVWSIATQPYSEAHFAVMPCALVEPCIKAGSKPGDTILDPFAGAGTVSLVAERLGRDSIGIELNPEYVAMAAQRIRRDCPMFTAVEFAGVAVADER